MKTIELAIAVLVVVPNAALIGVGEVRAAAIFNGDYSQTFDSLASGPPNAILAWANDSTIPGVHAANFANPNVYVTDNGFAFINTIQSLGGADAADRAFVSTTNDSGSTFSKVGIQLTNNTGRTISAIDVGYTAEQWYVHGNGPNSELTFDYSLEATSLADGTYLAVNSLDAVAPNAHVGGSRMSLDGNNPANQEVLSSEILLATNWNAGEDLWLRWTSPARSSSADGFAVDDVHVTEVQVSDIGDMDCDGDVDFDDIDEFVLGLTDPQEYENQIGLPPGAKGDTDGDGDLDFDDIDDFVEILNNPVSAAAETVPEPSAAALVGIAVGMLTLCRRRC